MVTRQSVLNFVITVAVACVTLPSHSQAQAPCATTVECAQKAVDAAARADAAAKATQVQLDALKAQLAALKVKPSGPDESNKKDDTDKQMKGDGDLEFSLRCAAGQVAVGVDLTLGGTCHDYCTGNGHPVERFKVVCQPLEIAK
jgi:hypothetical protein